MTHFDGKYPRYSTSQMTIHWLTVLLIIMIFTLPLAKEIIAPMVGGMANVFMLHKSLAVVLFFLTIIRINVVIKQGVPRLLPKKDYLLHVASKIVQGFLYLFLLALPISGYLMSSQPINFFTLFQIPVLNLPESIRSSIYTFHITTPFVMLALIALHAVAALYHHFIRKDNILRAMLPLKQKG